MKEPDLTDCCFFFSFSNETNEKKFYSIITSVFRKNEWEMMMVFGVSDDGTSTVCVMVCVKREKQQLWINGC